MLYGKYRFTCRFKTDAILPFYKGSTFRGVFGHALKRVVCAIKQVECTDCVLKQRCVYAMVFETPIAVAPPEGARVSAPPHPFVIEPPLTDLRHYAAGDRVQCGLVLFGETNRNLSYFVYAFEQMGKIGIGKRIRGKRGRFFLESVNAGDREIYSCRDRTLLQISPVRHLNLTEAVSPAPGICRVSIVLETPLRLKFKSEFQAALPFHVLVRAMLRRMSSLCDVWDDGEPALDYKGLVERAKAVRITHNDLRWFDWRRYSNRRERKMFMGGLVGSATYEGHLGEYLPLMAFSEKAHLGKNTSFGLGKIRAETA